MNKLPSYYLKDIAEICDIDINIELFKINLRLHQIVSGIIFKEFKYPEDAKILEKYGKYIKKIDKIEDTEDDRKYLRNITELGNGKWNISYLSNYSKIKEKSQNLYPQGDDDSDDDDDLERVEDFSEKEEYKHLTRIAIYGDHTLVEDEIEFKLNTNITSLKIQFYQSIINLKNIYKNFPNLTHLSYLSSEGTHFPELFNEKNNLIEFKICGHDFNEIILSKYFQKLKYLTFDYTQGDISVSIGDEIKTIKEFTAINDYGFNRHNTFNIKQVLDKLPNLKYLKIIDEFKPDKITLPNYPNLKILILSKNILNIESYSKCFPNLNKIEIDSEFYEAYTGNFGSNCFEYINSKFSYLKNILINGVIFNKDNYSKDDKLLINCEYFEIYIKSIQNYYDLVLLLPKLKTLKILYTNYQMHLNIIKIYNFIINNQPNLIEIFPFLQSLKSYEFNSNDLESFFKSKLENIDLSSLDFDKDYAIIALILYHALYKNNISIIFIMKNQIFY